MNEEEYQEKLKSLDEQLDDLEFEHNNNRTNLENQADEYGKNTSEAIALYNEKLIDFKIRGERILNEVETLQRKIGNDFPIDINELQSDFQEKQNKLLNIENEIQIGIKEGKNNFLNQEDDLQIDFINNKNKIEDERDDLKEKYYR